MPRRPTPTSANPCGLFSLLGPPGRVIRGWGAVSVEPPSSARCAETPKRGMPTKPFWGTRETALKQTEDKSSANYTAAKAPGGSYEPFISLGRSYHPPENRGRGPRGRHRGGLFWYLRALQFGLHPDRARR